MVDRGSKMLEPLATAAEAWAALDAQRRLTDGDGLDLHQHGLQTAERLLAGGARDDLVVAGLLHDLGDGRVSAAEHAAWAAELVRPLLGERVAWLIGAHADAKRYLCRVESGYLATLSTVSRRTLVEQGCLMTAEEAAAFAAHPWALDALRLRRSDDAGKDPRYRVPAPERFLQALERAAGSPRGRST